MNIRYSLPTDDQLRSSGIYWYVARSRSFDTRANNKQYHVGPSVSPLPVAGCGQLLGEGADDLGGDVEEEDGSNEG